jgi:hypothetical protein
LLLALADQLSRGRTVVQILSGKREMIVEYTGAEGYACRWGHLIEIRLGFANVTRIYTKPQKSNAKNSVPSPTV